MNPQKPQEGNKRWLRRRPETMLDWMIIVFSAIAFYMILNKGGYVLGLFNGAVDILEHNAYAGVHHQRHVVDIGMFLDTKLGKIGNEFWRQIIHAEKIHVFKTAQSRTSACA